MTGTFVVCYLLLGCALFLPLTWNEYRRVHNPDRAFWPDLGANLRRKPLIPFIWVVMWPLVVWDQWR
jgi:hypothetical protein